MAQKFLDPAQIKNPSVWVPSGPIPKHVRDFGHVPDTAAWKPGDLLLLSAIRPGWVLRRVAENQLRGGYHQSHARWHHAAVYLGKNNICEASIKGVRYSSLYSYVGTHLIRIRRDFSTTPEMQWEIAMNAMARLTSPYSFMEILRLAVLARWGFWMQRPSGPVPGARATICSRLYADAYMLATGKTLWGVSSETTPAFLSSASNLTDLDVSWHALRDE